MPFAKGQSGNPGGRPKADATLQELARAATPEAIRRSIELMAHADGRISLAACNTVMDRAYGKPVQMLANDPDNPFEAGKPLSADELADQLVAALAKAEKKGG